MTASSSMHSSALRAGLIAGMVIMVALALAGSAAAAPTSVAECRTLQEPGAYVLAGNLTTSTESCLVVDAPNVILLGDGHVISGGGSAGIGIEVRAHANVTVANLTVDAFESGGVWTTGTTGFAARNLTVNATGTGLKVENGDAPTLTRVHVSNGTGHGIAVVETANATVRDAVTRSNDGAGVRVDAGSSGSGSNLTMRGNAIGIWLRSSPDWVADGVVAANNEGSAVRVTGAPGTVRGLELGNGVLDVRARGVAFAVDAQPPDAPDAHRYLGPAVRVQNVSEGASSWLNASAAWSAGEVAAYQVREPRWQRWNGSAWVTVLGFNRAVPTDRRVAANATEFGVLAPMVRDDVIPPDATVRVNGTRGANGWWIASPTVRVNATDAYSGVASRELRVDDGEWRPVSDSLTLDREGVMLIRGRATDRAGNRELTDERTVRVDRTAPVVEASASGERTRDGQFADAATVRVNVSDALAGVDRVRVRVDGGPWRVYDGPVRVTDVGDHTMTAEATDRAGNRQRAVAQFTVADRAPPTTRLVVNPPTPDGDNGWYLTRPVFRLEPTPADATPQYRLDDGEFRAYESPVQVPDGRHVVAYRSTHPTRSSEPLDETRFRVDTQAPQVRVDVPTTARPGERVRVEVIASDETSGLRSLAAAHTGPEGAVREVTLEGENEPRVGTFEAGTPGDVRVTVTARDHAGHVVNATQTVTVACPDGEVYRDGACEPVGEPRVEVRAQDANTVVVGVENATGDALRLIAVHSDGREKMLGTGRSATWNTGGFKNGQYRVEARDVNNATVASTSYVVEHARASVAQATLAVGIGVVLLSLVQLLSVAGQSTTVLSGRTVRFLDLVVKVVRRILSIEYREQTKDRAAIRRVPQFLATGVAAAALAWASTLAGLRSWTLARFLSHLPTLGGAALVFSGVWYGGDWLVGQLTDEDAEYVLLGSGLASLVATTILFRSPFGSPGYVNRSDDVPPSGSAREREKAVRALADLGLVAAPALAFLPAMRLWNYGFGETGLLLVVMTVASSSVPLPPLPNYRVWRWRKPVALCVFALGIALYVGWQQAVLPDAFVVGVGLAGVVAVGGFMRWNRRQGGGAPD